MQYDNIYEIKENKKDNNFKTQTLITSTKSRVPNYTKIHQRIVKMQEKKNPPKMKKKREIEREINILLYVENVREREKEREITFCVQKNYE